MTPPVQGSGRVIALVAGGLVTLAVSGAGVVGLFFLLVALNGFSERQALPWLAGYVLLVSAANAAFVALTTWLVVRRKAGGRTLFVALLALGFTLLPYALAAVAWLVAVARARLTNS